MAELGSEFGSLGISGRSLPADQVGRFAGQRCLVLASAACVWDDVMALGVIGDQNNGWHTMCVNDIAMHWPGVVNHLYSNQHRWIPHWVGARRETIDGHKVRERWGPIGATHSCGQGGQYTWPWPGHGTSTLNAVYTALALGYSKVVLCGAPLDNSPHYFEPPWCRSKFEREVGLTVQGGLVHWSQAAAKVFKGRVFSMSGRTKELLGAPP